MSYTRKDIIEMLSFTKEDDLGRLRDEALSLMGKEVGNLVYYRGIIEFSNICRCDCRYCGIRKSNSKLSERYTLERNEIVDTALWCADQGYGSIVLQSGERVDPAFISFVESVVAEIKERSRSEKLPKGLGITLGIGEQSRETYRRLYEAGAHRYLLRIETTDPALYRRLHPKNQTLENRIECLGDLKEVGFQVGTGVMIGIPGQTLDMLARDIEFFRDRDIDMIGMGPYITHPHGDMASEGMMEKEALLQLSLNMIAATRLVLRDVNIAATTALQALVPDGRERGLGYGANVTMPNLTPIKVRKGYQLYEGKPCLDESGTACGSCLLNRIRSVGRDVGFNLWGDSPHVNKRKVLIGNRG
ncbi:MAG: [FeFe] hydrogenase H-cluster radical SAM maturase HydE [Spirochaetales bacterium]|nr:[FeFe] hydrogenase H-cluster radical SAM maturase HydE [Spirochaetales bacterium]